MFSLGENAASAGNQVEATKWFLLAAEGGNSQAMVSLGLSLMMEQEMNEAKKWLGLAVQLGNTFAMTVLGGLLKIEGDLAAAKSGGNSLQNPMKIRRCMNLARWPWNREI